MSDINPSCPDCGGTPGIYPNNRCPVCQVKKDYNPVLSFLENKLLSEGYVPEAMQDDDGGMYEIPESTRIRMAKRIVELISDEVEAGVQNEREKSIANWTSVDVDIYKEWLEAMGEECHYDHHGYCQAHFLQPAGECVYKRTKDRIAVLETSRG